MQLLLQQIIGADLTVNQLIEVGGFVGQLFSALNMLELTMSDQHVVSGGCYTSFAIIRSSRKWLIWRLRQSCRHITQLHLAERCARDALIPDGRRLGRKDFMHAPEHIDHEAMRSPWDRGFMKSVSDEIDDFTHIERGRIESILTGFIRTNSRLVHAELVDDPLCECNSVLKPQVTCLGTVDVKDMLPFARSTFHVLGKLWMTFDSIGYNL